MENQFNNYQEFVNSTKFFNHDKLSIIYPCLGLSGEVGEVSEKIKKELRDNNGEFGDSAKIEIAKELGDVLWYLAALASDLGVTLEDIANMNVAKIISRKERGTLKGSGDNR